MFQYEKKKGETVCLILVKVNKKVHLKNDRLRAANILDIALCVEIHVEVVLRARDYADLNLDNQNNQLKDRSMGRKTGK